MKPFVSLLLLSTIAVAVYGQVDTIQNRNLLTKQKSNIIVEFGQSIAAVVGNLNRRTFKTQGEKRTAVMTSLKSSTNNWHRRAMEGLERFGVEKTVSHWLTNTIYVQGATPQAVAYLSALDGVVSIKEEAIVYFDDPAGPTLAARPTELPWGIRKIEADKVWNATGGNRGEGVKVGIIDTGVRATHEALRDNWVGFNENGWFDAVNGQIWPQDRAGHGTHTTGTIAGKYVGVAPEARYLSCRACDYLANGRVGCPTNSLIACGQFMYCPTNVFGTNPNCDLAPKIVSNSWGRNSGNDDYYNEIIDMWTNAGIIPVFSIGNSGPGCGTNGSPGDQPGVISVGATNETDVVSDFSSRGPAEALNGNDPIPYLVAPGELILSTYIFSDQDYELDSGTSMAAPHVSGAVALMISKNPELTYDKIRELLRDTAGKTLPTPNGEACGATAHDTYPNNVHGHGLLNVFNAWEKA